MAIRDYLKEVLDYLQAQAGITAVFGSRIFAGLDVPPPEHEPSNGLALTFRIRGGLFAYSDAITKPSVQFKVYGDKTGAAGILGAVGADRALVDNLHNAKAANFGIKCALIDQIGQTLFEPNTDWPFVLSFYNFIMTKDL